MGSNVMSFIFRCFQCNVPIDWKDVRVDSSCKRCRDARWPGRYLMIRPNGDRHVFNHHEEMDNILVAGDDWTQVQLFVGEVPVPINIETLKTVFKNYEGRTQSEQIIKYAESIYQTIISDTRNRQGGP